LNHYLNPEDDEIRELGEAAIVLQSPAGDQFVVHSCDGLLVVNPIDGPYTAEQFELYIEPAVDDATFVGFAVWAPATNAYVPLG